MQQYVTACSAHELGCFRVHISGGARPDRRCGPDSGAGLRAGKATRCRAARGRLSKLRRKDLPSGPRADARKARQTAARALGAELAALRSDLGGQLAGIVDVRWGAAAHHDGEPEAPWNRPRDLGFNEISADSWPGSWRLGAAGAAGAGEGVGEVRPAPARSRLWSLDSTRGFSQPVRALSGSPGGQLLESTALPASAGLTAAANICPYASGTGHESCSWAPTGMRRHVSSRRGMSDRHSAAADTAPRAPAGGDSDG